MAAVAAVPPPDDDAPEVLEFDVNELTLGEIETIEEIVGRDVLRELGRGTPGAKTLIAVVYVIKRRSDPDITLDDVRRMNVNALRISGQTDPKEPGG
jgi:hypothetical protein